MIEVRDNITNAAIEAMRSFFDNGNSPDLGIFWYDTNKKELFGVYHVDPEGLKYYHSNQFNNDIKTYKKLHQDIWEKLSKGSDERFKGDYTKVPRGRIFEFKNLGFIVYTGSWIDDYPEAKDKIISEFDLPKNTEFRKDSHWDLGHGWSDEF